MKTITGVIHGMTIELNENPGIPEGEVVEISMRTVPKRQCQGDGLRRCAGAMAENWSIEDDQILNEIEQERQAAVYRAIPE